MLLPVLISGLHRSGTSLVIKLLNETADVVALNEPMRVMGLAGLDRQGVYRVVDGFAENTRERLQKDGRVRTKHQGGQFTDNIYADDRMGRALRPVHAALGEVDVRCDIRPGFTLAIKHNAAFAALAKWLTDRYPCYAIIRNPLSVLLSWQSVDIPANRGMSPVGSALDSNLGALLAAADDDVDRQIRLMNWFFQQYDRYFDTSHVIRYEDLVTAPGTTLQLISPAAADLSVSVSSRNTNPLYDRRAVRPLARRLLEMGGAYQGFYSPDDIQAQEAALLSTPSNTPTDHVR